MELDDEEYHVMEIVDVSFEEVHRGSDIMRTLFDGPIPALLESASQIIASKEDLQRLKKDISKLNFELKESFNREVYRKSCALVQEVMEGKRGLRELLDKSYFEFMLAILDRPYA